MNLNWHLSQCTGQEWVALSMGLGVSERTAALLEGPRNSPVPRKALPAPRSPSWRVYSRNRAKCLVVQFPPIGCNCLCLFNKGCELQEHKDDGPGSILNHVVELPGAPGVWRCGLGVSFFAGKDPSPAYPSPSSHAPLQKFPAHCHPSHSSLSRLLPFRGLLPLHHSFQPAVPSA